MTYRFHRIHKYSIYIFLYSRMHIKVDLKNNHPHANTYILARVFANGSGDRGSIPGYIIRKAQKMVLNTSWLNTQHYKVWIKIHTHTHTHIHTHTHKHTHTHARTHTYIMIKEMTMRKDLYIYIYIYNVSKLNTQHYKVLIKIHTHTHTHNL